MTLTVIGVVAGLLVLALMAFVLVARGHNHDCTEPKYLADQSDPTRRWFHGALAIYKGDCGDPGYWDQACALKQLSFWGCSSPNDIVDRIGHYQEGETTPAFDHLRIIWLARLAEGAGWFSAEQSWQSCAAAKSALVAGYPSWEAVATDMSKGRVEFYDGELSESQQESTREAIEFARQKVLPHVPFR